VVSYETYALVRDIAVAQALKPITMKGISCEVVPYAVRGVLDTTGKSVEVFSEHLNGLEFYLNTDMVDAGDARRVRNLLQNALKALGRRTNETLSSG
jgi:hypothetical protein